jgi:hypothetical protein
MHAGAKVSFTLPEAAQVRLELYDVGMHKVQDLAAGAAYKAGTHQLELLSQNLAGGIYFLRMEAGGHVAMKKLAVIP